MSISGLIRRYAIPPAQVVMLVLSAWDQLMKKLLEIGDEQRLVLIDSDGGRGV